MGVDEAISVEVAYGRPDRQVVIALTVPAGTQAIEAIQRSNILEAFPEIDLEQSRVGIFGKLITPEQVLEAGDRVEIYRPLRADPREVRRRLAAEGKTMGKRRRSQS